MQRAELPLNELMRLGLGSYHVLAGETGLSRPVAWVTAIPASLARDHKLAPFELILLIPPYQDLAATLRCLAQGRGAGVVLTHRELPEQLVEWANAASFPVFRLPETFDPIQTQRVLLKLLINHEAGLLVRKREIQQRVIRLSTENRGIEAIARALAEIADKGIVVQDKRLQMLATVPVTGHRVDWGRLVEWVSLPANLPAEFHDRKRAGTVREPVSQTLAQGGARLVVPIVVRDIARGFISLVSPVSQFDQLDRMVLEEGAAACALEMAKVKAVNEARKRLTGDLIEAVLTNSVGEVDAARWADRAGYRRAGPHLALTFQWASPKSPSMRRLETIISGEVKRIPTRAVAQQHEDEIVVFYALGEQGFAEAQQWAQRLYDLARNEFPHAHLALGLGRASDSLLGLRQSYREAARAMALEHKLHHNRPQYFGDLGIYRLLLQLDGSPELRTFSSEILGSLVEYDQAQGTDLVETLTAYFQHNANLAQTAQAMHLHRNTLLYRLQRAAEIGKFDLDNAETRLAIQLALRAHEISREDSDFLPPL